MMNMERGGRLEAAFHWDLVCWAVGVSLLFAFTCPSHFLVADEVAYFEQALAWAGGKATIVSDYPPGTALVAAGFIALFGPKAVFWSGITAWLVGILAIASLLNRLEKPTIWALYPALFLPGIVLTRTLMSDLSSFALASIFLSFYARPANRGAAIVAGLAAGLGVLFRETNLLWALPFLAGAALRSHAFWKILWCGFLAGLGLRLGWGWLAFSDLLFVRDSGIGFSVFFLPQNLAFYLPALLVLAPGGLYFLIKNPSPYRWEIAATAVLFLGVYGCYGYEAFAKSGAKALVLQGRFLVPLLPFMALAVAEVLPNVGRRLRFGMALVAFVLFGVVQFVGRAHNAEQQRITDTLLHLPTLTHYTFTPDESRKYLNALHGQRTLLAPSQNSKPVPAEAMTEAGKDRICYAHLITRSDSADWLKKTKEAEAAFEQYFRGCKTVQVCNLTIRDGTRLRVWKIQTTKNDE
ncbi:MAG: hypothetical protein ACKVU2_12000 [Saprospiraceae bacterium]